MCVYVSINKCLICGNTQSLLGDIPPLAGSQFYVLLSFCDKGRAAGPDDNFPHQGHELNLVKRSLSSQELLEGAVLLLWGPSWLVWGHPWHPWMATDSCCPLCKWGVQPRALSSTCVGHGFLCHSLFIPFPPSPHFNPPNTHSKGGMKPGRINSVSSQKTTPPSVPLSLSLCHFQREEGL